MATRPIKKPTDIFDRDQEWRDLADFATAAGPGLRLGIVRGRRRQGKSFLLRHLTRAYGGFYYQALEEEQAQALEGFGTALGGHLKVPGGRLALASWTQAFDAVADLQVSTSRPALVVIDEFPYMLAHSPELQSIIQRAIDSSRATGGPPVRLILCGSALAVMASLLSGTRALRGRATLDLVIQAFGYGDAARFWEIDDPRVAFLTYAVFGGTPGYRDIMDAAPPKASAGFGSWLAKGPLNPASALFREDDYLLTGESRLTDRALYHSVLAAIAQGKTTQGAIASALGREQRGVQYPLRALEESGFVHRDDDLLRGRRPTYRLADPILRFHHAVTRLDVARFEERRTDEAWADAQVRFNAQVLGPQFEQVARDFTATEPPSALGGTASRVGRAVINDAAAKTSHEIDVVVRSASTRGPDRILLIGEAKYTRQPPALGTVTRLGRLRDLLARRDDVVAQDAKLAVFSGFGFTEALTRQADARDDLLLFDLPQLYAVGRR